MTTILLIRHGENDTVGKTLTGRLPGVHLNDQGKEQAIRLAEILENTPVAAIYSSPLERTIETAQPLAEAKKLEITILKDLLEIDFGDWQGKTMECLRRKKLWHAVKNTPSIVQFPHGERYVDAQKRLVNCIETLIGKHAKDDVVVCFCHADSIRLVMAYYLDVPLDSFQRILIDTASISVIVKDGDLIRVPHLNLTNPIKAAQRLSRFQSKKKNQKDSV